MGAMPNNKADELRRKLMFAKKVNAMGPTAEPDPVETQRPFGQRPIAQEYAKIDQETARINGRNVPRGTENTIGDVVNGIEALKSPGLRRPYIIPPNRDNIAAIDVFNRTPVSSVPSTRTVGSNSPEKTAEIGAIGRDREALMKQLYNHSAMIRAAKAAGNLPLVSQLEQQFATLKNQRADTEADGRNVSLSQERSFVSPDGAVASRNRLNNLLPGAIAERINSQPVETGPYQAPRPIDKPFSNPQDEYRRQALVAGEQLNPVIDKSGNLSTAETINRLRMQEQMARKNEELQQAKKATLGEVTGADRNAIDNRFEQTQMRTSAAELAAKDAIARRKKQKDFETQTTQNERDIALAGQERKKTGTTIEDIQAKTALEMAKAEAARAGYASQGATADAELSSRAPENVTVKNAVAGINALYEKAATRNNIDWLDADRVDAQYKVKRFADEISQNLSRLTPNQKAEYQLQIKQMADKIDRKSDGLPWHNMPAKEAHGVAETLRRAVGL